MSVPNGLKLDGRHQAGRRVNCHEWSDGRTVINGSMDGPKNHMNTAAWKLSEALRSYRVSAKPGYGMRREHFTLDVSNVDWVETGGDARKPSVTIDFSGPESVLRERLTGPDGNVLDAAETDAALRLTGSSDDDGDAVVSVTNRVTGDFILELNVDASYVLRFIRAARGYGERGDGDGKYEVSIDLDGDPFVTYDKRTFLVYDEDGSLLRSQSLIPSGVEL